MIISRVLLRALFSRQQKTQQPIMYIDILFHYCYPCAVHCIFSNNNYLRISKYLLQL